MSEVTFDAAEKYEQGRKQAISQVQHLRSCLNQIEELFWARNPADDLSDVLSEIIDGAHLLGMTYALIAYNEGLEEEYGSDNS